MNATEEMLYLIMANKRYKCRKCGDFIKQGDYYIATGIISPIRYHISCVKRYPYLIDWEIEEFDRLVDNLNL